MAPPFALFEIAPERVNSFFMYVLSILGGGVAGFFGAMAVGRLFDRIVLGKGKYSAEVLHKIFRILCGLGVAILIAILMFPGGGGGTGTGNGSQNGPDKTGSPTGGGPNATDPKTQPDPKRTDTSLTDSQKVVEEMTVKIRAGTVTPPDAFYKIDEAQGYVTLGRLQEAVKTRAAATGKPIDLMCHFVEGAGKDTAPWGQLHSWTTEPEVMRTLKVTAKPADERK